MLNTNGTCDKETEIKHASPSKVFLKGEGRTFSSFSIVIHYLSLTAHPLISTQITVNAKMYIKSQV